TDSAWASVNSGPADTACSSARSARAASPAAWYARPRGQALDPLGVAARQAVRGGECLFEPRLRGPQVARGQSHQPRAPDGRDRPRVARAEGRAAAGGRLAQVPLGPDQVPVVDTPDREPVVGVGG